MRRGRLLVSVLAVAALVLAPLQSQAAPNKKVSMIHFGFEPEAITVKVGTTVTWTYDEESTDPIPNCESPYFQSPSPRTCKGHSTTSAKKGLWDSGVGRAKAFPFSYTFDTPGKYKYYCKLHGGPNPNNPATSMNGVVTVK